MSDERFDVLAIGYLDGLLSERELAEFLERLHADEQCRDAFVKLCVQTSLLMEQADETVAAAMTDTFDSRRPTSQPPAFIPHALQSPGSPMPGFLRVAHN